jgi:hypothetical protein
MPMNQNKNSRYARTPARKPATKYDHIQPCTAQERMGRIAVDNIPLELIKRLIGAAEKDMVGISAKVRQVLDETLPPLGEVKNFYVRAIQK